MKGIPDFDENGNLPPACYDVTLNEIKKHFVDNFPDSKTRKSRFDCFVKFYKKLLINVKSCVQIWINGSFVQNKLNPNDIDFVILLDNDKFKYNSFEGFYLKNEFEFKTLLRDEFTLLKEENNLKGIYESDYFKYGCDFFLLSINNNQNENDKCLFNYWFNFWGHDRNHNKKGFLLLNVDYEVDLNGI